MSLKWKMEKCLPRKCSLKAIRSSYTHIWQSKLQTKIIPKRQRRSLHINKRNNPLGVFNYCKYIHSECWHTQFHKGSNIGHKCSDPNKVIMGDFSAPLSAIDRLYRSKINKEISEWINTVDQMDLIDIYRIF
jgi:hypothetical protein